MSKIWCNPTGQGVRSDSGGDGKFGAPRGERPHFGTDFLCDPGQGVVAVTDMQYRRLVERVYVDDTTYRGMEFETPYGHLITYFYVDSSINHLEQVKAGQLVGLAQDISKKYGGGMKPHVHVQVAMRPYTAIIKGGSWNTKLVYVNPLIFIDLEV